MPLMEGILKGLPRNHHAAAVDGIVTGMKRGLNPSLKPDGKTMKSSPTRYQMATFGAGATPQGKGDMK